MTGEVLCFLNLMLLLFISNLWTSVLGFGLHCESKGSTECYLLGLWYLQKLNTSYLLQKASRGDLIRLCFRTSESFTDETRAHLFQH